MPDLHITTNVRRPFAIISVAGELDIATCDQLGEAAERMLDRPGVRLLFDLTDVTFMDSSGIDVIIEVHVRLGGDRVAVCGLSARHQRLFDLLGLTERLPVYPTLRDALSDECE
ncbi:STAS domain-containing protein [Microbispora sp. RL4-1S]|uniref:Anti-sigma factor antagonist n=1 Tax=Microbispora oryzae TaxID=2806554 RepID=A0A940WNS0_9ACTN|nr:STAS domain-containing protein [Microbispora oryzae]MBP2706443.1 STAS domain-containing protein [Microbispora oryzae]